MRSASVMILSPCFVANSRRSGRRAIVPSSFMISQITALGFIPAICARSTLASICDDLESVLRGELAKIRQARHRAVLVHDLAEHRARIHPRDLREIDARFGLR